MASYMSNPATLLAEPVAMPLLSVITTVGLKYSSVSLDATMPTTPFFQFSP